MESIQNLYMENKELWFLFSAHSLIMLYFYMFHDAVNGVTLVEQT